MIRLLVCDDEPGTRAALRALLHDHPVLEVVGEAADGREAVALAAALAPDAVLMDVGMPVLDGVGATERIRRLLPSTTVVAFTGSDDAEDIMRMTEAGASAYCVKGAPLWELERAVAGAPDPLVRLAHALARRGAAGGTGDLVARELAELTGAALAATYLAAPDLGLSLAGTEGVLSREALLSAPGVVRRAFEDVTLARADAGELLELVRLGCACSEAIAVPLSADGNVLGALLVAMPAHVQLEVDAEVVCAVGDLAAAHLLTQRRLLLTHAEARRDALTGLPNRRAFDEHLGAALRDTGERGDELSLVLFDVDDFKRVNDTHGHAAGDRVLAEIGRVAARGLRPDETLFRFGGEEFALVVAGDADVAHRVAERLRFELSAQRRLALPTLSGGIASAPEHGRTPAELVDAADAALYAAKQEGKDRLATAGSNVGALASLVRGALEEEAEAPSPDVARRAAASFSAALDRHLAPPERPSPATGGGEPRRLRILVVDDDPALRMLLRTTFELIDIELDEAESAADCRRLLRARRPDVVVLDVGLPGADGLTLCREIKRGSATHEAGVVLLTGADAVTEADARAAGAELLIRKPFSPLELLAAVERLANGLFEGPFVALDERPADEQLLLYARDLRSLLEVERGQRALLQTAFSDTVEALAGALESKDSGTGQHSQRVKRYAAELAGFVEPALLADPTIEFGFLLHDIGKIGIPDHILRKMGPLTAAERRIMETHTILGEQMLGGVALLRGEALRVVRSHHERWDGRGYPDGLVGEAIPLSARVFAVADALDAMSSDRPYRSAASWDESLAEIRAGRGHQFDPQVTDALAEHETRLRRIHYELAPA